VQNVDSTASISFDWKKKRSKSMLTIPERVSAAAARWTGKEGLRVSDLKEDVSGSEEEANQFNVYYALPCEGVSHALQAGEPARGRFVM
jgi:hypothetical protein